MILGRRLIQTNSLIFSAIRFDPGGQGIGRGSSSSTSVRRCRTRPRRRSVTNFVAGSCRNAVIKRSKICRGCSIQLSEAGSNITGDITARRFIRRCANWTAIWSFGPRGNTRSCVTIFVEQHTGSRTSRVVLQSCSPTGRWERGVAPCWELYESRGSRTVLREPRGAIPRGYSPGILDLGLAGRGISLDAIGLQGHEHASHWLRCAKPRCTIGRVNVEVFQTDVSRFPNEKQGNHCCGAVNAVDDRDVVPLMKDICANQFRQE
jgi:hypothetical protein